MYHGDKFFFHGIHVSIQQIKWNNQEEKVVKKCKKNVSLKNI